MLKLNESWRTTCQQTLNFDWETITHVKVYLIERHHDSLRIGSLVTKVQMAKLCSFDKIIGMGWLMVWDVANKLIWKSYEIIRPPSFYIRIEMVLNHLCNTKCAFSRLPNKLHQCEMNERRKKNEQIITWNARTRNGTITNTQSRTLSPCVCSPVCCRCVIFNSNFTSTFFKLLHSDCDMFTSAAHKRKICRFIYCTFLGLEWNAKSNLNWEKKRAPKHSTVFQK